MRAPQPVNPTPFLTVLTPTFRRPEGLARCLRSLSLQTAAADVQHIVFPDHVGHGLVGGLYGRIGWYAGAVMGRYVNVLCDDDYVPGERGVETLRAFAADHGDPAVIVTRVIKTIIPSGMTLPICDPVGEPVCGQVDLTSYHVRADVWHAHVGDYGLRYEGDFDHVHALWKAGHSFAACDLLWAVGGASHGRPEVDY